MRGELTDASSAEQAGAGLDQCTPAELERFRELNERYQAKFGFPFILAVAGKSRHEILAAFEQRLAHSAKAELEEALDQIARIARFRLDALIRS
jgi:OHCU decarboxylase